MTLEKRRGDRELAGEIGGASLDPFNPQTAHSQALLELFKKVVLADPAYAQRLEWHYSEFKKKGLRAHERTPGRSAASRRARRRTG